MEIKKILTLLITGALLLSCTNTAEENNNENVACTMEAKICPDGSSVGRVPPACEFAPCPEINENEDDTKTWETYSDENLTFRYPTDLGTEFIGLQTWPPKVTLSEGIFSCAGEAHWVEERAYCVSTETEGAAGSTYITYNYLTNLEELNQMVTLEFTLRFPQCANYPEPNKSLCEEAQSSFDVDKMVDQIAQSVQKS